MDKAIPSNGHLEPGLSIRNGPLEEMEVDDDCQPPKRETNGHVTGKRKSRQSLSNGTNYKEASSDSEEDAKPSVGFNWIINLNCFADAGITEQKASSNKW